MNTGAAGNVCIQNNDLFMIIGKFRQGLAEGLAQGISGLGYELGGVFS